MQASRPYQDPSTKRTAASVRALPYSRQRALYVEVQQAAMRRGAPDAGESDLRRLFGGGPYFWLQPEDVPFDRSLAIGRTVTQDGATRWRRPYPNYQQFGRPEMVEGNGRQWRVATGEFVTQMIDDGLLPRSIWGREEEPDNPWGQAVIPAYFRLPRQASTSQGEEPLAPEETQVLRLAPRRSRAADSSEGATIEDVGVGLTAVVVQVISERYRCTGAAVLRRA